MRGNVALGLLASMLVPALVGCGGSASSGASGDSAAPLPTQSPTDVVAPTGQQLSAAELGDVLPPLSDLPAGFTVDKSESDDSTRTTFLCGADLSNIKERNAHASSDFADREGLSAQQMSFGISQFDSADQASQAVEEFATAVDNCPEFTVDGAKYTVTPMSAGTFGDRTVAYKLSGKSGGFDVGLNIISVVTGPSVIASLSASAGVTASSVADLVRLTGQTVARYEDKAGLS